MMDKRFLAILTVVVLGLAGLFIFTRNKATAPNTQVGQTSNHTISQNTKKAELVVYGDFQCPACAQFYTLEKQILQKYSADIAFTFRHFPLDSIHPNGRAGSRAAEAAGLQNKFFEMHDLLYENQNAWVNLNSPLTAFEKFASQLGLNIEQFKTDFAGEAVNSTINADLRAGQSQGVDGTPAYFLNGKRLNNNDVGSMEKFSAIIDQEIQKASIQ